MSEWRTAASVLCGQRTPQSEKLYKTIVCLAMLYESERRACKVQYTHKMSMVEMRMLKSMTGNIILIRNGHIHQRLRVAHICDKIERIN